MLDSVLTDLSTLADAQAAKCATGRNWYQARRNGWPHNWVGDLLQLACRVRQIERMPVEQVLPTFFTEEALAILNSLPNEYWLWRIINDASKGARGHDCCDGDKTKIDAETLHTAMTCRRQNMGGRYDLNMRIEKMTTGQALERMAEGILLLGYQAAFEGEQLVDKPVAVYNPIFAPQQS